MSAYVLVPLSNTTAARVPIPRALPLSERAAWLATLTPDDLAKCEVWPYTPPAPPAKAPASTPTEDAD